MAALDSFQVRKLAPALGAEITGLDLTRPLAPAALTRLRAVWLDHLVLRFRGQMLSDPQLLALSRQLGELDPPGPNPYGTPFNTAFPEINVISNIKDGERPLGNLGDGEAIWHQDMTYIDAPPMASMLHALEVPAEGGDTFWSNLYMAWDEMPEALRRRIDGRSAIHDSSLNSAGMLRKGMQPVTDPRLAPGARHPLVVGHPETGRPTLLLGRRRNSYILGMELAGSEALLDELWAHASQPQFVFRQQWQVGDLILWDNRCTLHRRDAFDPASRRRMHRTQIKGAPFLPMAAEAVPA
jgi:taurine dioxygenase